MARYLLDTDTLSWLVREPAGTIARRIAEVGADSVATSPVVAGELRFAAHRSGRAALVERVDELLARLLVVSLDDAVARSYVGAHGVAPFSARGALMSEAYAVVRTLSIYDLISLGDPLTVSA